MLKATTSSPTSERTSNPPQATMEQIQTSLQTVTRSLTQARSHEHLLQAAGVRIDRAGVALLFKLRLHSESSLRVTSLAEMLAVDAPTVTRKVQQLERLGFVARDADPDDRRATRIRLTTSGQETLDRILEAFRERLSRAFDQWSSDDVQTFASLLEKFSEAVRNEMESIRDQ